MQKGCVEILRSEVFLPKEGHVASVAIAVRLPSAVTAATTRFLVSLISRKVSVPVPAPDTLPSSTAFCNHIESLIETPVSTASARTAAAISAGTDPPLVSVRLTYDQTADASIEGSTPPDDAVESALPAVPEVWWSVRSSSHTAFATEALVTTVLTSVVPVMFPVA